MLIDSHCHLNYKPLHENLEEIVKNAKSEMVEYMLTICTKISDFDEIISIIEKYDFIFGSVGIHPHNVETDVLNCDALVEMAKHSKIIGFGETGLDYYYLNADKKLQIKSFVEHIYASQTSELPVIIHTRSADDDTADILNTHMKEKHFKGLLHCFTSSKELARKALDLGLYISISGICTFKNSTELQDIVKWLPIDKILIETDSPFLAPVPMRGKTNQPAYVKYVAQKVSEIKGISAEDVANITSQNFLDLFASKKTSNIIKFDL